MFNVKKRKKEIVLAAVTCVLAVVASVLTSGCSFVLNYFDYNDNMTYCINRDGGGLALVSVYDYYGDTIDVRSQIDGIPVTRVKLNGGWREDVTKIEIYEGVESVFLDKFNNVSYLFIPYGVKDIEIHCKGLERIDLTADTDNIDLSNCTSLRSVTIPRGTGDIDLSGCTHLERVRIWEGVERIDASAFDGCVSLKYLEVPAGIEMIGDFSWIDQIEIEEYE